MSYRTTSARSDNVTPHVPGWLMSLVKFAAVAEQISPDQKEDCCLNLLSRGFQALRSPLLSKLRDRYLSKWEFSNDWAWIMKAVAGLVCSDLSLDVRQIYWDHLSPTLVRCDRHTDHQLFRRINWHILSPQRMPKQLTSQSYSVRAALLSARYSSSASMIPIVSRIQSRTTQLRSVENCLYAAQTSIHAWKSQRITSQ